MTSSGLVWKQKCATNCHVVQSADAQLEDSGAYMCQLNTDPMRFKMGHLNVVITPDIVHIQGQ